MRLRPSSCDFAVRWGQPPFPQARPVNSGSSGSVTGNLPKDARPCRTEIGVRRGWKPSPKRADAPSGTNELGAPPTGVAPWVLSKGRCSLRPWARAARTPWRRRKDARGISSGSARIGVLATTHEIACHGEDEVGIGFDLVRLRQEHRSGPVSASATTRPGVARRAAVGDSLKLDVGCKDLHLSGIGRRRRLTAGSTMSDLPKRVLCLPTRFSITIPNPDHAAAEEQAAGCGSYHKRSANSHNQRAPCDTA